MRCCCFSAGEQSNSNDPKNRKKEKKVTSMQALEAMIDNSSDQCLRHIVVQEFLNEKWTKRIRRWYIAALVLYATFLISLTTYIGLVKSGKFYARSINIRGGSRGFFDRFAWLTWYTLFDRMILKYNPFVWNFVDWGGFRTRLRGTCSASDSVAESSPPNPTSYPGSSPAPAWERPW